MTTLYDVTLDLARHARGVQRHKISQVSTDGTLSSPTMENLSGEYVRGTVWFTTGNNAGKFTRIIRASNQNITVDNTDLDEIEVGDVIMICPWIDFGLTDLINAINSVLYRYPILAMDNSLTWNQGQLVYDIPEGVSDIRRVQIMNTNGDNTFTISHKWTEDRDGKLRFHSESGLYAAGGEMQIYYRKLHGEVYEPDDEIDPMVDTNYLRNMAFLYLWRTVLIHQHKDNPVAADLFNEAKLYESEYTKFNTPERKIMIRDFFVR